MFRTFPLSIIRSFSLYTQQWSMSADLYEISSVHNQEFFTVHTVMVYVSRPVWHRPLLCVQWKTPDDGQRNCPKHVELYSKNKFEKLVHLVGFIIRMAVYYKYHAKLMYTQIESKMQICWMLKQVVHCSWQCALKGVLEVLHFRCAVHMRLFYVLQLDCVLYLRTVKV